MDPKLIEMNNLRVLNDFLNQTIDVLVRSPRLANGHTPSFGYSPFAGAIPGTPALGTDQVWGPYGAQQMFGGVSPFTPTNPFTGLPVAGPSYGTVDPFIAQRSPFGGWQQSLQPWQQGWQQAWGQSPWGPISETTRQAQFAHALAAKQQVLEAMCRACGVPV